MDRPDGPPARQHGDSVGGAAPALAPAPMAPPAAAPPAGNDPHAWRAALTSTLATLLSQAEAGRAAAAAQAEASRAALQAQVAALQAQVASLQAQVAASQAAAGAQAAALDAKVTAQGTAMRAQAGATMSVTARLDRLQATIDAGQIAHGIRYAKGLRLAKRERLSDAEEVLAAPNLSEHSILSFFLQDEALELRAASRTCREAVAEHGWSDFFGDSSVIKRNVAGWRKCVPLARAAVLDGNKTLADADFSHLRGVCKVSIEGCNQATITDAAFAHLRGIHTLDMGGCNQATITDAAFAHLRGIHTLSMSG